MTAERGATAMNLPNILTIVRMILVPVFAVAALEKRILLALGIFVVAGITDALDGYIARRFHLKTRTGAILDPLADKLLLITAYLVLALYPAFPVWLTGVVIVRDMVMAAGIVWVYLQNRVLEVSPSLLGKATTFVQLLTITVFLLSHEIHMMDKALYPLYLATASVTVASAIHYVYTGFRLVADNPPSLGNEG
ncbi:MAG: CDP-diacylglycerol--glycerol-3-phosphate 3-phosphatidyltransferase [bacterium]|nr:CDP-diacylglycerol--glycerol-3-phosphate 3-phosphatidyltransferase [bacterium]